MIPASTSLSFSFCNLLLCLTKEGDELQNRIPAEKLFENDDADGGRAYGKTTGGKEIRSQTKAESRAKESHTAVANSPASSPFCPIRLISSIWGQTDDLLQRLRSNPPVAKTSKPGTHTFLNRAPATFSMSGIGSLNQLSRFIKRRPLRRPILMLTRWKMGRSRLLLVGMMTHSSKKKDRGF